MRVHQIKNNHVKVGVTMEKTPEIYVNSKIILSMAGSGNPWDYFKPSSKLTLRALHDGYSIVEIQELFQVSEEELSERINLLVDANLVKKQDEKYYPTFLIVDEEETKKTFHHAEKTGRIIADELTNSLEELKKEFSKLEISKEYTIDDLSLVLIGSKILDIGLLEVLAKDRTLLRPAPKRPSPERPDAQYYIFMIDGQPEHLGKYGEESKDLPWENWTFVTFGQNIIRNKNNIPREKLEERCNEVLEKKKLEKPEELAEELNVPILSREDSLAWRKTAKKVANQILLKVKEKEKELLQFYNSLKVSRYANSLGEFMCWYIHVAYAWAIDFLAEEKTIFIPAEKFGSLIIYTEGPQGLLAK
jgi:hypothetical protein